MLYEKMVIFLFLGIVFSWMYCMLIQVLKYQLDREKMSGKKEIFRATVLRHESPILSVL